MTAEPVASGRPAVAAVPARAGEEAGLRERLGEFRALLVISLLMTESVSEDQTLELAASSAPGLGSWRVEGFGCTDVLLGNPRPTTSVGNWPHWAPGEHGRAP